VSVAGIAFRGTAVSCSDYGHGGIAHGLFDVGGGLEQLGARIHEHLQLRRGHFTDPVIGVEGVVGLCLERTQLLGNVGCACGRMGCRSPVVLAAIAASCVGRLWQNEVPHEALGGLALPDAISWFI
jgi:hypothetical protein